MGESYQIQLIRIVRLTNKAGGRPEGESYHIQPIMMVRLTITRWEVWKRVIIFSI